LVQVMVCPDPVPQVKPLSLNMVSSGEAVKASPLGKMSVMLQPAAASPGPLLVAESVY
jgi:hypothetical protein